MTEDTPVSTGTTPATTNTTNNTVYTNTIPIPLKRDYIASLKVPFKSWKNFIVNARKRNFSANELLNQFIEAYNGGKDYQPEQKTVIMNMNLNINKAESNPIINVAQLANEKEIDNILSEVKSFTSKPPANPDFTKKKAADYEKAILRVMRSVRTLTPEKTAELRASLDVLTNMKKSERV